MSDAEFRSTPDGWVAWVREEPADLLRYGVAADWWDDHAGYLHPVLRATHAPVFAGLRACQARGCRPEQTGLDGRWWLWVLDTPAEWTPYCRTLAKRHPLAVRPAFPGQIMPGDIGRKRRGFGTYRNWYTAVRDLGANVLRPVNGVLTFADAVRGTT